MTPAYIDKADMADIGHHINIVPISQLNEMAKDPQSFIRQCEQSYIERTREISDKIAENCDKKPVVLLAGPSGSGKTTTAYTIGRHLERHGKKTIVISMDDYFLPGPHIPETDGKVDYEKPERVDIPLLTEHLKILAGGGEIEVPKFNFSDQTRSAGKKIKPDRNTVVIIEGIHALNPAVTGGHHDYASFVYVSVRTRISAADGTLLHPSKIRLLRRLSRDSLFRGRSYIDTIANYAAVQRGENLYIMPYKTLADHDIDTFYAYELCVYTSILKNTFDDIAKDASEELVEIYGDLPMFLDECAAIPPSDVPEHSMIKEFIG